MLYVQNIYDNEHDITHTGEDPKWIFLKMSITNL